MYFSGVINDFNDVESNDVFDIEQFDDYVEDELLDWKTPKIFANSDFAERETIITTHGWTDYYDPDVCETCDTNGKTWMRKAKNAIR